MSTAKYLPILLFAVAAGGCVSEESLPSPSGYDRDVAAAEGPTLDHPHKPINPKLPPDVGVCGEVVRDVRDEVHVGDLLVEPGVNLDLAAETVAVTGVLTVVAPVDRPVDLGPLGGIRCVGGDVRVKGGGHFDLEDLPELEYIGGALIVDEPVR